MTEIYCSGHSDSFNSLHPSYTGPPTICTDTTNSHKSLPEFNILTRAGNFKHVKTADYFSALVLHFADTVRLYQSK